MSSVSTPAAKATVDAESMARNQREISVSEFFAKNRHLLGFDNPRKALLTTVKEAVDNSLDACEEAGILPEIFVGIRQISETRFHVTVRDNGPGIVKDQIANIFGKLLYGSKFHRLKMSRGQQGIGIAASGMYGLMTTGKPMVITTKPSKNKPAHRVVLAIDTKKNRADIHEEQESAEFPHPTGTQVEIELEGKYQRGRQSVDEFLDQTAIANPHVQIIYQPPAGAKVESGEGDETPAPGLIDDLAHADKLASRASSTTATPGGTVIFPRGVKQMPIEPKEIQPHPLGVELGTLLKMARDTESKQLGAFLQNDFCRVSLRVANEICQKARLNNRAATKSLEHSDIEKLYQAIQDTRLMAPPTDCLAPIGVKQILAGLLKGVKAEFYTAATRDPAVYRGNPFQIEVGLAFGGDLPLEEPARVIRFANRVPLLYQQSACCSFKAVVDTLWRNYGISQPKGSLPMGPLVVMIHMASVWVPFTSESKEAIADYDEIRKEMKLALGECGRKLKTYLNRRIRMRRQSERRDVFFRYIGEVVRALNKIDPRLKPDKLRRDFEAVAKAQTLEADTQLDEDGNPIQVSAEEKELDRDDSIVIVESAIARSQEPEPAPSPAGKKRKKSDDNDPEQAELFE